MRLHSNMPPLSYQWTPAESSWTTSNYGMIRDKGYRAISHDLKNNHVGCVTTPSWKGQSVPTVSICPVKMLAQHLIYHPVSCHSSVTTLYQNPLMSTSGSRIAQLGTARPPRAALRATIKIYNDTECGRCSGEGLSVRPADKFMEETHRL